MMRILGIIQARMGSTRLSGKVLKDIGGQTMLARVVQRTQRAQTISQVIVATSESSADDRVLTESERLGVAVFRGSEKDVLDRYYWAAKVHQAEAVVRITSDCPLIDPSVVDEVVKAFLKDKPDYASNTLERTYPRGLDTEVIAAAALARAWREAGKTYQRVHVTPYFYENPNLFHLVSVKAESDFSGYRLTVDTPEDLAFVQKVYERLGNDITATWTDVLALLAREPALNEPNRHIQQKALQEG
jgi:spore coat polysaccharide biosynthesis protein SpsF